MKKSQSTQQSPTQTSTHLARRWSLLTPKLFLTISLITALLISLVLLYQNQSSPAPLHPSSHQDITVNQDTKQTIQHRLGPAHQTYQLNNHQVLSYPAPHSDYTFDLFYLQDDLLVMKELHYSPTQNPISLQQSLDQHGQPDHTYYLPPDMFGQSYVHFYQSLGQAIYLNQSDIVFKIQTFTPLDPQSYLQTWGSDLQTTKPTPTPEDTHEH